MPKISVVIPVYNVEAHLEKCVDSVLNQTFKDFEVILVNDGSPDNCGDICDEYEKEDSRVFVIHQENRGLSAARNSGLEIAQGEYIMFLDSDDFLSEDCFETLIRNEADLIIGTITMLYSDGRTVDQAERADGFYLKNMFGEVVPELIEERRLNYVHAKLYKKSIITENAIDFEDDMLTSAEDTVFNFTYLKHCNSIFVSVKPVHFYNQMDGGLSKTFYPDRFERFLRLGSYVEEVLKELSIYNEAAKLAMHKRIVLSANWSLSMLNRLSRMKRKQECEFCDVIYNENKLKEAMKTSGELASEDLTYLLENGSEKYVSNLHYLRLKKNTVWKIKSIIKNDKK